VKIKIAHCAGLSAKHQVTNDITILRKLSIEV